MANELSAPVAPAVAPTANPDDLGIDREFIVAMARLPLIAVVWFAAAWAVSALLTQFGWLITVVQPEATTTTNLGPIIVIAFGMLLAAFIDGYAFKVPNWCTLSLVLSGWYIGIMHDLGSTGIPGVGGFMAAFGVTMLGFFCLFPALFIGGMGQGDVKMTMGFGSWLGACFGLDLGAWVLLWSFAVGVIVGGVFGLLMMAMRRQIHKNLQNTKEIFIDLKVLLTEGPTKAAERANSRRKDWVRLPYGVPLCVGFLGTLCYIYYYG
jgi:prepilin peptidase CpaA